MTSHVEALGSFRQEVEQELERAFSELESDAIKIENVVFQLSKEVRDFTMRGGKRFRALLLFAGASSVGLEVERKSLVKAGASLELLQSYLLIHDDWMDQDEERRGGPSVHVALGGGQLTDDEHTANSLAILAGDLASTLAWELMVDAAKGRVAALKDFSAMQREVIFGQSLDVLEHVDAELVSRLKTTSYTVLGPLMVGASLANGSLEVRACLEAFATPIGRAFQLRDDLLGTFGDLADTGKPGDDLLHGKRNGVTEVAFKMLDEIQKREFETFLEGVGKGRPDDRIEQATRFKKSLREAGVEQAIEKQIDSLYKESRLALQPDLLSNKGTVLLEELGHKMAYRKK